MQNLSYENEFCMKFHFYANQSHFHKNGFALRLALKQRHKGTRKWPITLPNGFPLNCLFYAGDLILISRSAAVLQKQLNILHDYSEKWLLKINPKKTKTLILQKQNRTSTRDKFSFFLNGTPIDKASQYSYLGITFSTNGSFANSKKVLVEKTRRSIFASKRYLDFNKLYINTCNKLFQVILYFFPLFYTDLKFGELMIT